MISKVDCVLKLALIQSTSAKRTNAIVAMILGSHTLTFLPTKGVSKMAKKPTGAKAMPAVVAV